LRSADPAARELLASVDASRAEVLWRLRLPSAIPSILSAARYNVGLALAAAYYGEGGNVSTVGLGAIGRRAAGGQNPEVLWASILATVVLGVIFLGVISIIERLVLRWHVSQRSRAAAGR
jgi:NitT/TauT family transport system permease protein